MVRVCSAMYLLRSYTSKLLSDCSYPLILNCTFIVLGNITQVSILSGINFRKKNIAVLHLSYLVMLCLVSSCWL